MEVNVMKKTIKILLSVALVVALALGMPSTKAYAGSEIPEYFDFGFGTVKIPAGGQQKMWLRSTYDYNYFIEGSTSDATYLECDFKQGSRDVVIHIGEDEQGKNVFFHFYVSDERVQDKDIHDCVEVYVQNIKPTNQTLAVPIARGKTGSIVQTGKVSMLYNDKNVPMASFSLTKGEGHMASYGQAGVVSSGANYIELVTGVEYATPVISPSDKEVMKANGIAGVSVNGKLIDWP